MFPTTLHYSSTSRCVNNWTYTLEVHLHHYNTSKHHSFGQIEFMCGNIKLIIGKIKDNGNVFIANSSNTTVITLENGMQRVLVTFSDLEEDRKYFASYQIQYVGGVMLQSQQVEISKLTVS